MSKIKAKPKPYLGIPGYQITLKAHNVPLKKKTISNIVLPSCSTWHLIFINSIKFHLPSINFDVLILDGVSETTGPFDAIIANIYKITSLDRLNYKEEIQDEIFLISSSGRIPKKSNINSKIVMKHIKHFTRQLPVQWESSIFVRGYDNVMTSYKFVITGPRNTPYDNGLFLYSMELPLNYPESPPTISILSTSGGKFRPNPNLYSGGKVCIDLLGTFGNSWTAKSNMVQVLLAIQAQIMLDIPLSNEPAFNGVNKDHNSCIIYNALQRIITIMVGMIEPLSNPYIDFESAIKKYFLHKRHEIAQQMYTWTVAASQITLETCSNFLESDHYNYTSGSGDGAGGGVGLLPSSIHFKLNATDLRIGIFELTKAYANKVLVLLNIESDFLSSVYIDTLS